MDAHGSDVGTSFTADPENTHVLFRIIFEKFALVDGSDSEFSLNGGDSRIG